MSTSLALDVQVRLRGTQRTGTIIGHSTYTRGPDLFLVEYVNGTGDLREDWFHAEELLPA